jgi:hypothetical protein
MPRTRDEVESVPDADEDPFYVLMEDDSLVNELTVNITVCSPCDTGRDHTTSRCSFVKS